MHGRHERLLAAGHGGGALGRARHVVRAGVAGGGERRHVAGGHVRVAGEVLARGGVAQQGGVGEGGVLGLEGRPGVGEPIGPEVRRHARVRRHPRVHPDPLHHGLAARTLAELGPEAVRVGVGHHVAVVLLAGPGVAGGSAGPASRRGLVKVLVSERGYSAPGPGHELRRAVGSGAGPQPHVVGEGEAGRQRGVGEPLQDPVG